MGYKMALTVAMLAAEALASPVERQTSCSSYSESNESCNASTDIAAIISTRGTSEAQGPSFAFRTMNSNVLSQQSGGTIYDVVYPADFSQNSAAATTDIVNKVTSTLGSNSNTCIILQGYSQGAAATVNALSRLTGNNFNAVKGVFLAGNPFHKAGLACNVDTTGGDSTKNVNGLSVNQGSIPDNWLSKTLDVCNKGDGVCDTTNGVGINAEHLAYGGDASFQNLGTTFILNALRSGGSSTPSPADPSPTSTPQPSQPTATRTGFSFPAFTGFPGFGGGLPSFSFPNFGGGARAPAFPSFGG